ncbi:hypothetical protein [Flavihumibacter profundi]|jgi:hypothetical protein|uniref:hypothetical protein n=1 Tax=Flavihumibacter profundi TaxID=2716883 RepID=UPI001CC34BB7|nr:hypothetical protein [Flavihumibacter profundi]MBZ5858369.1 hypothetical protein [Flavihumibacter profundi]
MQEQLNATWHKACNQFSSKQIHEDGVKSQLRDALNAEKNGYISRDIDRIKKIMSNRKGPGTGGKGNGIDRVPFLSPPLGCQGGFNFITQQDKNYFIGFSDQETVIDFAANNQPTLMRGDIKFLHQSVVQTVPATGEISLAGVTGYGSTPNESIFPGRGITLYSGLTHVFDSTLFGPQYGAIQATARLSHPEGGILFLNAGPLGSNVDGLAAIIVMSTIQVSTYDPVGKKWFHSDNWHVCIRNVAIGAPRFYDKEYYDKYFIYLGNATTTLEAYDEFITLTPQYSQNGKSDVSTSVRYSYSDKPVYVNVSVGVYPILMAGNEHVSGAIIACQKMGATPVAVEPNVRNFVGAPFVLDSIRICGLQ